MGATYRPKKRKQLKAPDILDIWEERDGKPTPDTFKLSRTGYLQLEKVQRDLFTDMEERESGNYIVSGLSLKVTGLDFSAFSLAVGQILYRQSYQSGNTDTNSGLTKVLAKRVSEQTGKDYYGGEIVTTLNELCRYAYGEDKPSTQQKTAMTTLIDTLHSTPVGITFPNGDKIELTLCAKMGTYTRKRDGAVTYHLILNPIFCENVKRNFSEFPQDITMRLTASTKKKTDAHYRLLLLLGRQDRRKPFVRYIDTLLEELGLTEAYKANPSRTEKKLLKLFEDMNKIGLLKDFPQTETYISRGKKRISKVTFILNPDFVKKAKDDEPEQNTEAEAED